MIVPCVSWIDMTDSKHLTADFYKLDEKLIDFRTILQLNWKWTLSGVMGTILNAKVLAGTSAPVIQVDRHKIHQTRKSHQVSGREFGSWKWANYFLKKYRNSEFLPSPEFKTEQIFLVWNWILGFSNMQIMILWSKICSNKKIWPKILSWKPSHRLFNPI